MYLTLGFGNARVPPHIDVAIAAAALLYAVYGKVSAVRFRRRAVAVDGVVLKSFPHAHFTSYFVSYSYQGKQRVAEYCGLPLITEYRIGQTIRILIDGTEPPDMAVSETTHNAPGAHSGTCTLEGKSLFSLWDIVFVAGAIGLLVWRLREL
jgi:hypothetical protein